MKRNMLVLSTVGILMLKSAVVYSIPNLGIGAETLPQGYSLFEERTFFSDYKKNYSVKEHKYIDLLPNEYYKTTMSLFQFGHGITDNLTIVLSLPYWDQKINVGSEKGSSRGLGDIYLYAKNKIIRGKDLFTGVVIGGGIKLPTGDNNTVPSIDKESLAISIGIASTRYFGPLTGSGFMAYWVNCKNHGSTDFRNQLTYRFTVEYPFLKKFSLQSEIKGDIYEGNEERLLEFSPGIQFNPIPPLGIKISIQIPVEAKGNYKYDVQPVLGVFFVY